MHAVGNTRLSYAILLLAICILAFVSCSKRLAQDDESVNVVLGWGLTNRVEIGMTLAQVSRNFPDFVQQANNPSLWPWETPTSINGRVERLGLEVQVSRTEEPIRQITFHVRPEQSSNCFKGSISCGLSFSNGIAIDRSKVISLMGEPLESRTENVFSLVRSNLSFSWRPTSNDEVLYYPQHGVIFNLTTGLVTRFSVIRKVSP